MRPWGSDFSLKRGGSRHCAAQPCLDEQIPSKALRYDSRDFLTCARRIVKCASPREKTTACTLVYFNRRRFETLQSRWPALRMAFGKASCRRTPYRAWNWSLKSDARAALPDPRGYPRSRPLDDWIRYVALGGREWARRKGVPAGMADEMSARPPTGKSARCRERPSSRLGHLATAFAVRRGISYRRNSDYRALGFRNPSQRWGVDMTVRQDGRQLRLLSVHLISGCWGARQDANAKRRRICDTLHDQIRHLKSWADARRSEGTPFVILGDFNRHWPWSDWRAAAIAARAPSGCYLPVCVRTAIPDILRSSTIWSPAQAPRRCWSAVRSGNCRVADGIRITARCLRRSESAEFRVPTAPKSSRLADRPKLRLETVRLQVPPKTGAICCARAYLDHPV